MLYSDIYQSIWPLLSDASEMISDDLIPRRNHQRDYVLVETDSYPSRPIIADPFNDSDNEGSDGEGGGGDIERPRSSRQNSQRPGATLQAQATEKVASSTPPAAAKPPPPPLNERNKVEFFAIVFGAVFLSINAGFINGVSFHMAQTSVTHVTGSTSRAGLALGEGNMEEFCVFTAIVLSFIFGSLITGRFMPHSSFHLGLEYGPLFLIGAALLLFACLVAFLAPDTNAYFYFAAMASGLQNSMTTKYSGNILRTTHMTGTATDIGLILGRLSVGDDRERWKLHVLVPMFVGFFFGGVMSVPAYYLMGRYSLILNAIVFFLLGLAYSIIVAGEFHISVWRAFVGFYEINERRYADIETRVKTQLARPRGNKPARHKASATALFRSAHKTKATSSQRPLASQADDALDDRL